MHSSENTIKCTLKETFGFDDFRQGQEQTIHQLLAGDSTLAIFPTGSGKSLCYQLTALHLPHLTLVVSPLLALIKDQLEFLASKGIAAASIDSTLKGNESQQVMTDVRSGKTKILMVSVERFKNERFRQFIQAIPVSLLVVDEAHCISEWGHNFRPDYLKLPQYRQALNIPLTLLLTATATKQVKFDMAEKFSIKNSDIVQTGFYRKNLDLAVLPVTSEQKNSQLVKVITQQPTQPNTQQQSSGIVYVTLQHTAEQVASYLQRSQVNACAYHAGMDNDTRAQIQADFMSGKIHVIVATIAFGMGIDKANIRFVIHYDLPKSIENYSQEIGRAGRDGLPSNCIILANLDGLNTVENFVYGDTPELYGIECVLENMRSETHYGKWELLLTQLSTDSNIRQLPLKTLLVQLELHGVIEPMYAYFADFKVKFLHKKEAIFSRFNQDRQDFLNIIFSHIQFKKVWGSLNFESLLNETNVDRNRVVAALDYLHEQQLIELDTKRMTEVFKVNVTALADPHLAKNLHQYFVEKEQKEINRIAALVGFFQQVSCLSANLARYFDDREFNDGKLDSVNTVAQCGHCSVCRGSVAKLVYSQLPLWPEDEAIISAITALKGRLADKAPQPLSYAIMCRFLAGMTMPLFTKNKVRQLSGFGLCEKLRYHDIEKKLALLAL